MSPPGPDAVLLLGPTACGKSQLAMQLALHLAPHLHAEIVAVDSAQVYRGMDIGTAKPSADERRRVPHHLLDLRDPGEPYSAADFERDAGRAITTLRARGGLPLLVGGSMLYAKALRDGLAQLPAADPQLRRELEAEAAAHGWAALHARLAQVDPLSASRLAPLDSQRIQRALEVHALSGEPLSALLARSAPAQRRLRTIALLPADRAEVHRRIEVRFDAMLRAGFLDEVRALIARGDLHPQLPSQRSVGYRQAWDHLRNATAPAQFRDAALAATRRLAKHQMTWLRSMHADLVLDPFAPDIAPRTAAALERMLAGHCP